MIIYFSGTGNSFSLAKKLGERIGDQVVPLKRASNDGSDTLVFVFPLYCEDIPPNVRQFLRAFPIERHQKVMGICTSGGGRGNAEYTFNRIMVDKGMTVTKFMNVPMVDNSFPAFFNTDLNSQFIDEDGIIDEFLAMSYKNESTYHAREKLGEFLVFNPVSKRLMRKKVDGAKCTGCGQCTGICPNDNIEMVKGKVRIGSDCTECFGCVHACPSQAVYIRRPIDKKNQYKNPNIKLKELNK